MKDRILHLVRMLLHSKGQKLAAVVIAVVTWYAIQPAISYESVISDVPVRVMVDTGWAVLEQSSSVVDVHFRGSREGIRYLRQDELEVLVDIRGLPYGESLTVPLEVRQVRAPAGVRPFFIRPSELVLSVDQESEKRVPVRVHIQGSPPEGYDVETFVSVPDTVLISGPRLRLDAIDSVRTTPIDLEGRLQSFRLRAGLVPPSRAWVARVDPERVDVDVVLVERSATATLEEVRIRVQQTPGTIRPVELKPSHVTLKLLGRAEVLETLTPRDVQVYVEASMLTPDKEAELPVRVHLPPKVRVEAIVPPVVAASLVVAIPETVTNVQPHAEATIP